MTITISKTENYINMYAIFGADTKTGRMHTRYCKFCIDYKVRLYHSADTNNRIRRIKKKLIDRWSNQFWGVIAQLNQKQIGDDIWCRNDVRFISGGDTINYAGKDGYGEIHLTKTYEVSIIKKDVIE